jgi:hypothetical protein
MGVGFGGLLCDPVMVVPAGHGRLDWRIVGCRAPLSILDGDSAGVSR